MGGAIVGGGLLASLVCLWLTLRATRATARLKWQVFDATIRRAGLELTGRHVDYRVRGQHEGVAVALELVRETVGESTQVSLVGRAHLAEAGAQHPREAPQGATGEVRVFASNPPLHELGSYREASTAGSLRVFTPEGRAPRWLTRDVEEALASLPGFVDLHASQGNVTLRAGGLLSTANEVLTMADLLVQIAKERPSTPLATQLEAPPKGVGCGPGILLLVGFVLAVAGGAFLPMVPGVSALISPIGCEDGWIAEAVWTQTGPGEWSGGLACIEEATERQQSASVLAYFGLMPLAALPFFVPAMLLTTRRFGAWKRYASRLGVR